MLFSTFSELYRFKETNEIIDGFNTGKFPDIKLNDNTVSIGSVSILDDNEHNYGITESRDSVLKIYHNLVLKNAVLSNHKRFPYHAANKWKDAMLVLKALSEQDSAEIKEGDIVIPSGIDST